LSGAALALLLTVAHRTGWLTEQSGRTAVLLVPLLTYTGTVAADPVPPTDGTQVQLADCQSTRRQQLLQNVDPYWIVAGRRSRSW
jgi:hypothetical protein